MNNMSQTDDVYLDVPAVRHFMSVVAAVRATTNDPVQLTEQLRPAFGTLLADPNWLPLEFSVPYSASQMGGGIGQYLLFRAADRSVTLFSLVVPAGAATPIHDHLAWGLVGLYRGEQLEDVYQPSDAAPDSPLVLVAQQTLRAGEFYTLLPPTGDIHRVTTTSAAASISIHLLGNDAGCVTRHRFELEPPQVISFRSGYSNVACTEPDETAHTSS